jgi:hypothetical protein
MAFALGRALTFNTPNVDSSILGTVGTEKFSTALRAMADQNVVLSVGAFLQAVLGDGQKCAEVSDAVSGLLPGIYNRLISQGKVFESRSYMFAPSQKAASPVQREYATKLAEYYSMTEASAHRRMALSSIRNITEPTLLAGCKNVKLSSDLVKAEKLATDYAMYKLAYLVHKDSNVPFTQELVVLQNYVS